MLYLVFALLGPTFWHEQMCPGKEQGFGAYENWEPY